MHDPRKSIVIAASVLLAAMTGSMIMPRQAHADDEGLKICHYRTTTITQRDGDGTILWQTSTTVLLYCVTTP